MVAVRPMSLVTTRRLAFLAERLVAPAALSRAMSDCNRMLFGARRVVRGGAGGLSACSAGPVTMLIDAVSYMFSASDASHPGCR